LRYSIRTRSNGVSQLCRHQPIHKHPRENGFSVFVDAHLRPYADQWAFLASIQPMAPHDIEPTILRATGGTHPLDVTFIDDGDLATPWKRKPNENAKLPGVMPQAVTVIVANMIYFAKSELPQALANRLIRLAAFQNPEFYKAQAMRLSVWDKPRVIGNAANFSQHIALPRGCQAAAQTLLKDNGIRCDLKDERYAGVPIEVTFGGTLRSDQALAVAAMLKHDTGVIGTVGGGKSRPTGQIDIAVMQSLSRQGEVQALVENYGQVIVDECHHVGATSFDAILKRSKAKYVLGLTATPIRRDGLQPIIFMQCGPIRHTAARPLGAPQDLQVITRSWTSHIDLTATAGIQDVFRHLASDAARTHAIAAEIKQAFELGRKVLVLTERTEHLLAIERTLGELAPKPHAGPNANPNSEFFVLHGRISKKQRANLIAQLEALLPQAPQAPQAPRILLATGKWIQRHGVSVG
jgi:hypothetical protein